MTVVLAACEGAVLVARQHPSSASDLILSSLVRRSISCIESIMVTPTFLLGWGLVISGALMRILCYRTLGPQYTFQRSVIKEHKLITSGPYAIVRHPAYTGYEMFTVGLLTAQLCKGSWVRECGILDNVAGKAIILGWVGYLANLAFVVLKRCTAEDETLKKEFGEQWITWSKRTTARLIPGIY